MANAQRQPVDQNPFDEILTRLIQLEEQQATIIENQGELLAFVRARSASTDNADEIIDAIARCTGAPLEDSFFEAHEVLEMAQNDHELATALGRIKGPRELAAFLKRINGRTIAGRLISYDDRSREWRLEIVTAD